MKNEKLEKFYADGFKKLNQTLSHKATIDDLLSSKNVDLDELKKSLKQVSYLAKKERKRDLYEIILGWMFILSSLFTLYLSKYNSANYYFLSIPVVLITLIYLLFIFINYGGDTLGGKFILTLKKLFFLQYNDLEDIITGRKESTSETPVFKNVFLEKQIKLKIKKIESLLNQVNSTFN